MEYLGESVAVGILGVDENGYDEMMVMHGVLDKIEETLFFVAEGHEPFEMSENWLKRLKPVEPSLGEKFQGSKHCLIIGRIPGANG